VSGAHCRRLGCRSCLPCRKGTACTTKKGRQKHGDIRRCQHVAAPHALARLAASVTVAASRVHANAFSLPTLPNFIVACALGVVFPLAAAADRLPRFHAGAKAQKQLSDTRSAPVPACMNRLTCVTIVASSSCWQKSHQLLWRSAEICNQQWCGCTVWGARVALRCFRANPCKSLAPRSSNQHLHQVTWCLPFRNAPCLQP